MLYGQHSHINGCFHIVLNVSGFCSGGAEDIPFKENVKQVFRTEKAFQMRSKRLERPLGPILSDFSHESPFCKVHLFSPHSPPTLLSDKQLTFSSVHSSLTVCHSGVQAFCI